MLGIFRTFGYFFFFNVFFSGNRTLFLWLLHKALQPAQVMSNYSQKKDFFFSGRRSSLKTVEDGIFVELLISAQWGCSSCSWELPLVKIKRYFWNENFGQICRTLSPRWPDWCCQSSSQSDGKLCMYIYIHCNSPFHVNSSPDETLAFSRSRFAHRGNPGQGGTGGSSKVIFFLPRWFIFFRSGWSSKVVDLMFLFLSFFTHSTIIFWFGWMLLGKGLNGT